MCQWSSDVARLDKLAWHNLSLLAIITERLTALLEYIDKRYLLALKRFGRAYVLPVAMHLIMHVNNIVIFWAVICLY